MGSLVLQVVYLIVEFLWCTFLISTVLYSGNLLREEIFTNHII